MPLDAQLFSQLEANQTVVTGKAGDLRIIAVLTGDSVEFWYQLWDDDPDSEEVRMCWQTTGERPDLSEKAFD